MALGEDEGIQVGCPLDQVLRQLSREWTLHILWVLGRSGPTGFGTLRRRIGGISPKVLTERLRRMEGDALISREQEPKGLRRVAYSLTDKGRDLHSALLGFDDIAGRWAETVGGASSAGPADRGGVRSRQGGRASRA